MNVITDALIAILFPAGIFSVWKLWTAIRDHREQAGSELRDDQVW